MTSENDSTKTTDDDARLRDALRRMLSLLADPQPGLFTWQEFWRKARDDILREMPDNRSQTTVMSEVHDSCGCVFRDLNVPCQKPECDVCGSSPSPEQTTDDYPYFWLGKDAEPVIFENCVFYGGASSYVDLNIPVEDWMRS